MSVSSVDENDSPAALPHEVECPSSVLAPVCPSDYIVLHVQVYLFQVGTLEPPVGDTTQDKEAVLVTPVIFALFGDSPMQTKYGFHQRLNVRLFQPQPLTLRYHFFLLVSICRRESSPIESHFQRIDIKSGKGIYQCGRVLSLKKSLCQESSFSRLRASDVLSRNHIFS
jgi:hypothetical protein